MMGRILGNHSDISTFKELHFFGQLFYLKGVNFINLQKGPGVQQISSFKFKNKLYDFSNQADNNLNAFEDTIGILKNLDLIIYNI